MTTQLRMAMICVLCIGTGVVVGRMTAPQAGEPCISPEAKTASAPAVYGRYGHVEPSTFAGTETKKPKVVDLSHPLFSSSNSNNDAHLISAGSNPTLSTDNKGIFYAAFEKTDPSSSVKQIFFAKSNDGAKTWSAPLNISGIEGISENPATVVNKDGSVLLVWSHRNVGEKSSNILFSRSADGGKAWSKAVDISHSTGPCLNPAMANGPNGSIHVVWQNTASPASHPDIHYATMNADQSWSTPVDISNTPGAASAPTISIGTDSVVHVSWLDTSPGENHPDIYYTSKSKDSSFSKPIDVSNSPRFSAHPSLACGSGSEILITWSDNSQKENAADIWCATTDKPGSFSKPINLSDTPGVSSEPRIAADNRGRVVAVWSDTSNGAKSSEVFTAVSFDNLTNVSSAIDLTKSTAKSVHPSVALGSDNAVFVWEEVDGANSAVKSMIKGFPHN